MKQQEPQKIGKYDVLDVLGRGGMGVVYRARDPRLGRVVAIKKLTEGFKGSPEMLQRFYEEANGHAGLQHNNIVIVFDAGEQDGEPFIVMEFIEGDALDKTLRECHRIRPENALAIVEQVCSALAYAHRKGIIHRDVKPANVIVKRDGIAKLLDFGIARDETRIDQGLTSTGSIVGTVPYMAPERLGSGPIDGRADIFSAGVLLYQLLTGHLPFNAEYPAIIEQIMRFHPPAPSQLVEDCPAAVDAIVARALAKSAADRYANADDMAMDCHEAAEGITHARVGELFAQAEKRFNSGELAEAQDFLRQLMFLDKQHIAGKRLLSLVDQRLAQQGRERRAQELVRLAKHAASDREWDRALALCDEALGLSPANISLVELRKSAVEGKQTQQKVSQLLLESASARKVGELTRARGHAVSAQQLDPGNSQILALCKVLEREIEEKRLRDELRTMVAAAKSHLAAHEFEKASHLLAMAESMSSGDAEVLRAKDELVTALIDERRKATVRRLEEKTAVTTTLEKLKMLSAELVEALKDFPNDPSLLRLRLNLEPRIKQLEDDLYVRAICKSSGELPPAEALSQIRSALVRVPGDENLLGLESAISDRMLREGRERSLAQRLGEARQAIDDRLYLEAVRILERCQAEGFSSYEVNGLLDIAKSEAAKRISQERFERTYVQAKRLIQDEDYESAVQLLRGALRQVNEPTLQRQMDEALQKQLATEQRADWILERTATLMRVELFAEAVLFLEEQPSGVRRLARIEQALGRARNLQEAVAEFSVVIGRCYAQMEDTKGLEDLKRVLKVSDTPDPSTSQEAMRKLLRSRCDKVYGERASAAIAAVREVLGQDDSQGAEAMLQETATWLELAPMQFQQELRALQAETAAAKKVLRFRMGFRR